MSTARRPIASLKQLIDTWRAGAGTYTDGDVVTVGQHAYVTRADVGTSVVMGGATNRENVVGGNLANVGTATSNLTGAATLTDEGGNWNSILGGYDNVVNGWACSVLGFHHKVGLDASHGTIAGGSTGEIAAGVEYGTIDGGNANTVSANYATIGGGVNNVAAGVNSTVGGGTVCHAHGTSATVGGGNTNDATGGNATIGGGYSNQATGDDATVAGGNQNTATAAKATVGGGTLNDATAAQATIGGGDHNDATAQAATVAGGSTNVASGTYSAVAGGYANAASGYASLAFGRQCIASRRGALTQGAGVFSAAGDAQSTVVVARRQTTDATPAIVGLDGTVNERILIAANTSIAFSALVVGRRTDAGGEASAAYKVEGLIKSDATTVAFVGTPAVTVLGESDAAWDCTVTANNTNKALDIFVTGAAGVTINWVARVTLVEVTG